MIWLIQKAAVQQQHAADGACAPPLMLSVNLDLVFLGVLGGLGGSIVILLLSAPLRFNC